MFIPFSFRSFYMGYYASLAGEDTSRQKDFAYPQPLCEGAHFWEQTIMGLWVEAHPGSDTPQDAGQHPGRANILSDVAGYGSSGRVAAFRKVGPAKGTREFVSPWFQVPFRGTRYIFERIRAKAKMFQLRAVGKYTKMGNRSHNTKHFTNAIARRTSLRIAAPAECFRALAALFR
jgi:hypothetical protein